MTDEIAYLTAADLVASYSRGDLSPVDVTRLVLERIERHNERVNAYCLVDEERALDTARESEQRWRRAEPCGLLDGVPVSIKDVFLTRGWPTLKGSRTVETNQDWAANAPVVARLREHGAVPLGKTTTPELGWKGITDSPLTGVTRNPWDTSRTPGGSSGGSAAAVALGMGPLSVGTDGGGSVRIPASFSGIFALKPTYGRIPLFPASPFGTLAHAGPMTRTVADAALMLDVLGEFDSRDWSALAPPGIAYRDNLEARIGELRIAYSPTLGYAKVDPEVEAAVREAVDFLAGLGAAVDEVDPGFDDPVEDFHTLWFSGAAKSVQHLSDEQRAMLDPGLQEICVQGEEYSAVDYLTAVARRMELGQLMGRFHEGFDLLITPTMPIPAFAADQEVPTEWPQRRWTSWSQFSYPFNMTQQPAASLPCGTTSAGLPVGLQVVGPRHADARVLAACAAVETARPWIHRRPPLEG